MVSKTIPLLLYANICSNIGDNLFDDRLSRLSENDVKYRSYGSSLILGINRYVAAQTS